jgi:hypothetical protein
MLIVFTLLLPMALTLMPSTITALLEARVPLTFQLREIASDGDILNLFSG